jgi:cell division protein FtsN
MKLQSTRRQLGGTLLGLIVGLLIGVAVSLGVALYVTKVPVPFLNKVPQRTAEQDAAEAERNKNWDPNSGLYGKNPARPSSAPAATLPGVPPGITPAPATTPFTPGPILPGPSSSTTPTPSVAAASRPARDPAAILGDRPVTAAAPTVATAAPLKSSSSDPFTYFVQAGAYSRTEEAEQQRAKLAMLGLGAKVTEREQSGRTVYRVRVGPYDKKDDADTAKGKLETAGIESALVRVQK